MISPHISSCSLRPATAPGHGALCRVRRPEGADRPAGDPDLPRLYPGAQGRDHCPAHPVQPDLSGPAHGSGTAESPV